MELEVSELESAEGAEYRPNYAGKGFFMTMQTDPRHSWSLDRGWFGNIQNIKKKNQNLIVPVVAVICGSRMRNGVRHGEKVKRRFQWGHYMMKDSIVKRQTKDQNHNIWVPMWLQKSAMSSSIVTKLGRGRQAARIFRSNIAGFKLNAHIDTGESNLFIQSSLVARLDLESWLSLLVRISI